ncbi:hypothetical protein SAMN06265360_1273 [Haloechinothrix alba]|uniref:Cas10/Cmr2 second palm domain-containing protein n=1 Tax=Haloechinothrix alba TaxID=664784 RepID=A0A238ZXX1_9PSEU|nr:hypothetical protein [Haloechinothrix alba]SNR87851.1 hypothetical protein SAMN06265360_1273 [Haloechinothrix alba]
MTTTYLDIAVVHIQAWLGRTPLLRGRRGASTMLSEATSRQCIERQLSDSSLAQTVEWNEEAGDIDGVVSLKLRTGEDATEDVERVVVRHLRHALPAATFRASVWRGSDYAEARTSEEPVRQREWPEPVAEWSPGRRCDWCERWPASYERRTRRREGEDSKDSALCSDCSRREEKAGYSTSHANSPGPEKALLDRIPDQRVQLPTSVPDTFECLAQLGRSGDDTHVATIAADGNGIGAFMTSVRTTSGSAVTDLPRRIHEATWMALVDALTEITADDHEHVPVIPHLVGGDDVLVSVPAHRGWAFADRVRQAFSERLRRQCDDMDGDVDIPTMSLGLVVHHRTVPIFVVVELAETLLSRAKNDWAAETTALAWHDITNEGPEPNDRPSFGCDTLRSFWPALNELAEIPTSGLRRLASLTGSAELDGHLDRLGLRETVDTFRGNSDLPLQHALEMVRWW